MSENEGSVEVDLEQNNSNLEGKEVDGNGCNTNLAAKSG